MIRLVVLKLVWTAVATTAFVILALSDPDTATACVPLYVLAVVGPEVLPRCIAALRGQSRG